MTCNCRSYNAGVGDVEEVKLTPPPELGVVDCIGDPKTAVFVDACIAHVIEHLWANGVLTMDSCCGHGGQFGRPNIMIGSGSTTDDAAQVVDLIAQVDSRQFDVFSWQRCEYMRSTSRWVKAAW